MDRVVRDGLAVRDAHADDIPDLEVQLIDFKKHMQPLSQETAFSRT